MLTTEQISYFETFGFMVMKQYFSPEEMDAITCKFDELIEADRKGKPFDGKERQAVADFAEKSPLVMNLIEDDRIYEPIEQLLGPDFMWAGSDGNLYVGDSGWHSDDSVPGYDRIKVAFYLDPVTKDTGCLRVIPGAHRVPLHADLKRLGLKRTEPGLLAFGVKGADVPAFPLESEPGDVVFFHHNMLHASYGGRTGRRMFTVNFYANPTTDEQRDFVRWAWGLHQSERSEKRVLGEAFLSSVRPRIKRITSSTVAKVTELGLR